MSEADKIIERLNLKPHPEGGFYCETYRHAEKINTEKGSRNTATGIYFLLKEGQYSQWHRVSSDEMWHYYAGQALRLEIILPDGAFSSHELGSDILAKQRPQCLVPAQSWQRAFPLGAFTLVGCTVHPGFDFRDFEIKEASELTREYPKLKNHILPPPKP